MKKYVGIDLGTTNSAICFYDGENVRLYKSPEQNDVTPSAIYIDKRSKYVGKKAYDLAPWSPDNSALKFKRMMGTNTPVNIKALDLVMTPEECSAEILKCCFGYLPEEIRNDPEVATVITVPAAFNQMQKDATMAAADLAGIGKVALMQEPVAAVMSEMRVKKSDGTFLIYDLGGGTLDIAIATSTKGRVSIQAHGGIEMCGGADFDRAILVNIIVPWLYKNFKLPADLIDNEKYKKLMRIALWAAEGAKIELSSKEEVLISLNETQLNIKDDEDNDIYLDISLDRKSYAPLIESRINDGIQAAKETIEKAGLTSNDIERIVFVGGPTQYKPLRDKVSKDLSIASSTDVNPMTAVAEGAAIFAESIDWGSENRGRKSNRGEISAGGKINLGFNFISRTPDSKAKIVAKITGELISGTEFQIDNLDTGWSSGKIKLKDGVALEVELHKSGENTFKVFVFDAKGGPIKFENNKIIISRTAATIDAIPASSSIGIQVTSKNITSLVYLVREGDPLPKKGSYKFRANEALKANSQGSLNFVLREGEIKKAEDNKFIGVFKINGSDLEQGEIKENDELICDYEILDSGLIKLLVSVEKIKSSFLSKENFYVSQEGKIDFSDASKKIKDEVKTILEKISEMSRKIKDPKIDKAKEKVDMASDIDDNSSDPETAKQAMDNIQDAKKILAEVRQSNLKTIQQIDLDYWKEYFETAVKEYSRESEIQSFNSLFISAQVAIDKETGEFDNIIGNIKSNMWEILWRDDSYVISILEQAKEHPSNYTDKSKYQMLISQANEALVSKDMKKLREIVYQFYGLKISSSSSSDEVSVSSNISGA